MAAGLGFKTFTTGEVLTAGDVNGYLMQGVLVFASAAARNAAITSPQEGQFAFTKDTNGLWYYDGAAWVASGATGDIRLLRRAAILQQVRVAALTIIYLSALLDKSLRLIQQLALIKSNGRRLRAAAV